MKALLRFLSDPAVACAGISAISVLALVSAYTAQYGFGLAPCPLCIYQRIPYALTTLLGLAGILLSRRDRFKPAAFSILLCSALFATGASIAFYHAGVEQRWWASAVEGCKITFETKDAQSLLDMIAGAATAPCDKPSWFDPVFGWTMAVWNFILSLGLSVLCLASGVTASRNASKP